MYLVSLQIVRLHRSPRSHVREKFPEIAVLVLLLGM